MISSQRESKYSLNTLTLLATNVNYSRKLLTSLTSGRALPHSKILDNDVSVWRSETL